MSLRGAGNKLRKHLADLLDVPRDIVLDLPKIVVVGNQQVFVENHRGILEYTPKRVRVVVESGELVVDGQELVLRNLLADEICVEGSIKSLTFNQ